MLAPTGTSVTAMVIGISCSPKSAPSSLVSQPQSRSTKVATDGRWPADVRQGAGVKIAKDPGSGPGGHYMSHRLARAGQSYLRLGAVRLVPEGRLAGVQIAVLRRPQAEEELVDRLVLGGQHERLHQRPGGVGHGSQLVERPALVGAVRLHDLRQAKQCLAAEVGRADRVIEQSGGVEKGSAVRRHSPDSGTAGSAGGPHVVEPEREWQAGVVRIPIHRAAVRALAGPERQRPPSATTAVIARPPGAAVTSVSPGSMIACATLVPL
jgi:hypothetical protein